jgi:PKD repeat protein
VTNSAGEVLNWNYYPSYIAYEDLMMQFAADHPGICKLITIATLASGRKILALKITDNPSVQENEPEFLYTSSIHGDELTGYILMLHLIDYLFQNYGVDQRITDMINNTEIYINPLANPDGTYHGGNNTVNGATRGNANNIDLNRNYPDPEDGQHPDNNPWQPETVAFMNFAALHHIAMSANFHGGAEVLNYPWDTWPRLAADNNWWVHVCREYADTVHVNAPSNYMNGFENGITNGYAWYTINGGRQDYMNYFRNCRELTIEISDTKTPPANQLENFWNYNYRSLLNYIEQVNYGLHGIVTDSLTGEPLVARVFISGHDIDSSHVFSEASVGDYHRLLKAGAYNVTFSANGYYSKTFSVQITDQVKTILDVQLYDGSLKTNFTCNAPVNTTGSPVQFQDQTAGNPQTWYWEFEGGNPASSDEPNPVITYAVPGNYNVKLVTTRPGSADSLTRIDYITIKPGYLLNNGTYQVCDVLFFDSGGSNSSYNAHESATITFLPEVSHSRLKASFLEFDLENSPDCINDRLWVYDGTDTLAPLAGFYCGTVLPADILASNNSGALTFVFRSNGEIQGNGWKILLECDSNVGIETTQQEILQLFPNPVTDGRITIICKSNIDELSVYNLQGTELLKAKPLSPEFSLVSPWHDGVYLIRIKTGNNVATRKIIVSKY